MEMVENYLSTSDFMYFKSANELFKKALKIDPEYSKAFFGKGHALKIKADKTSGNYDSALLYAERAIELGPEEMRGYGLKADILRATGKIDLAMAS